MSTYFRTLEISDPEFEKEQLRYLTVKSDALGARADIVVFVPPKYDDDKPLPLVILLHGVYGSAWSWAFQGGVHRTAMRLMETGDMAPMALAMPSDGQWGDGSGYAPHNGKDFEKWIVEEVPLAVGEIIPQCSLAAAPRFIAGLSMGGFGALRLGILYAERFSAISAHSAMTDLLQMPQFVVEPLHHYRQEKREMEHLKGLFETTTKILPPFRFDCGTADDLLAYNQQLHRDLTAMEIPHEYQEYEGGHDWSYWREHVKDSLMFFNGFLNS